MTTRFAMGLMAMAVLCCPGLQACAADTKPAASTAAAAPAAPQAPTRPPAPETIFFRADFDKPPQYGFGYKYPEGNWRAAHQATGGMKGGPAVRVTQVAGREQYSLGWATGPLPKAIPGNEAYVRLRIRYHESFRFEGARNKLVLFGDKAGRTILYQNDPSPTKGCTLGMLPNGSGRSVYPTSRPSHFGLRGISDDWRNAGGLYGSLAWKKNIDWTCAGPGLVASASATTTPRPGNNSAPAENGWYRVQMYVKAGSPPVLRLWINNGDVAKPTALPQQALMEAITTDGWDRGAVIGGYQDEAPPRDLIYDVDAFEIGTTFDPTW